MKSVHILKERIRKQVRWGPNNQIIYDNAVVQSVREHLTRQVLVEKQVFGAIFDQLCSQLKV